MTIDVEKIRGTSRYVVYNIVSGPLSALTKTVVGEVDARSEKEALRKVLEKITSGAIHIA